MRSDQSLPARCRHSAVGREPAALFLKRYQRTREHSPVSIVTSRILLATVLATGAATPALAQVAAAPALWEFSGVLIGISQPACPGADQQVNRVLALPCWIYRVGVLRADRDSAGSDKIEARRGMRDLGTLVELVRRLKWNLPACAAKSGLVAWRLGASATRSLGPDWRLFGFTRIDSVAGTANESSPLVRQTTGAPSAWARPTSGCARKPAPGTETPPACRA